MSHLRVSISPEFLAAKMRSAILMSSGPIAARCATRSHRNLEPCSAALQFYYSTAISKDLLAMMLEFGDKTITSPEMIRRREYEALYCAHRHPVVQQPRHKGVSNRSSKEPEARVFFSFQCAHYPKLEILKRTKQIMPTRSNCTQSACGIENFATASNMTPMHMPAQSTLM